MRAMIGDISFGPVWDQRGLLLGGIWLMLRVAVASMVIAVAGGLMLASLRLSRLRWVRMSAFVLIQVFRGVALYVLVLWLFNGLAVATGITLSAVQTGVIALSLLNSAYLAEVFRAGFEAIPAGQGEAAQAIGLSDGQAARFVLVPQMVRITFPSMGNVFVDIVKDTAILSVIGVSELMRETQRWAQFYFRSFEFYTAAGLIYLAIVLASAPLACRRTAAPRPPRRRCHRPPPAVAVVDADGDPVGSAGMSECRRLSGRTALVTGGARGYRRCDRRATRGGGRGRCRGRPARRRRRGGGGGLRADGNEVSPIGRSHRSGRHHRNGRRGDRLAREVDILVNNAGVAFAGSVLEATVDEWNGPARRQPARPFFALQAVARHMVARGSGKIVNTVSTSGFASSSTPAPIYDLTKGGLRQLTISAAVELAPFGVNVNGVAPGTVATELTTAGARHPREAGAGDGADPARHVRTTGRHRRRRRLPVLERRRLRPRPRAGRRRRLAGHLAPLLGGLRFLGRIPDANVLTATKECTGTPDLRGRWVRDAGGAEPGVDDAAGGHAQWAQLGADELLPEVAHRQVGWP